MRNRNGCVDQARGAFEEHQGDRNAIKFLRAYRPRGYVCPAAVFPVAVRPDCAIAVERFPESGAPEALRVADIAGPVGWPADVFDESPGLTEWKVDPGDPRAGPFQRPFELRKILPFFDGFRTKEAAVKCAGEAGEGFAA